MSLYEKLVQAQEKLVVVGLGYVGLPIAVEFAKHLSVIGFDINDKKIQAYKNGIDLTDEVGNEAITNTVLKFTSDECDIQDGKFIIVAVPTPIHTDKTPDLSPVEKACEVIGRNLVKGSIVVFESTVYPGVTEEVCVPLLEKVSGLVCGKDFKVGYSPERINPGDQVHRVHNIVKIVSGMDKETLEEVAKVYEIIVQAGVHRASTIKVAEATKLVENAQRDINIGFMNELAIVFEKMGICTNEVIAAMDTKWNALGFKPGLVGGHCIGVDPYYFIYQASKMDYHSQIIAAGRKINDSMGSFIADVAIKLMIKENKRVKHAKVAILGLSFKENCSDIRNTKVVDILKRLEEFEIEVLIADPIADSQEAKCVYGIDLLSVDQIKQVDCVIVAVAHECFNQMNIEALQMMCKQRDDEKSVIIDVKSILEKVLLEEKGYSYWSL